MDTVGTFDVYDVLSRYNIITAFHKFYTFEDYKEKHLMNGLNPNLYMICCGTSKNEIDEAVKIVKFLKGKFLCIDIANGYQESLIEKCKDIKSKNPNIILVAGNIATCEQTTRLIKEGGVDIVKIGIGPGSACLTREKTGVGVPQLSAVLECARAAKDVGGRIIADGGICCPGDVSKAFIAGADYVMMGGIFAGHDENPGDLIEENGQKLKLFYGMSSKQAMTTHYGKMNNYRTSEGREIKIKYKGKLQTTVEDYLGGIRSTCTYINCNKLSDMYLKGSFVKVTQQLNTSLV